MINSEVVEKSINSGLTWKEHIFFARHKLWYFYFSVFSISVMKLEGIFEWGEHLKDWSNDLQNFKRTAMLGPRLHLKSYTFYAYVMWRMFGIWYDAKYLGKRKMLYDIMYLSFKEGLAASHLGNINRLVSINPYFGDWAKISGAATQMKYYYDGCEFNVKPEGMLSFKRGKHPNEVLCDDILLDPTEKLEYKAMLKINKIFFEQVVSFPKEKIGQLHVIGTAQDETDLFFQLKRNKKYKWSLKKAIIDKEKKIALWPEFIPFERLMDILENELNGSEKTFNKEYQCSPVRSEDAYFTLADIEARENENFTDMWDTPDKIKGLCFAGFDIGKKRNPSHLSIYSVDGNRVVQVHQKWMDGWQYGRQKNYINEAARKFKIIKGYYDNTRGEFESFAEKKELHRAWEPMVLVTKQKFMLASALEKMMGDEQFFLLENERQKEMIVCVDNSLKAPETGEGHGDCYDKETELLTKDGWKFFKDIKYSDEICTLKDGEMIEYQNPNDIIAKDYKGKMYNIGTTQVDLLVTPRHKLYIGDSGYSNYKLRFPTERFGLQSCYKKDGVWVGEEEEYFKLEGKKNINIEMGLWLEFLGYYISEGHTTPRERNRYQIGIAQNGIKRKRIRKCLEKMPFKFTENIKGFWIYNSQLGTQLAKLGKSYEKYIPKEFKRLNIKRLKIVLDALMYGDGTIQKTFSCYYTSSKRLADDVQEILLKIGYSGNIYVRDYIGKKAPHGVTRHLSYSVSIIKKKNNPMVNRHKREDNWTEYEGKIYCVTVPNHIIYVRRNGKPIWSGNSFWSNAMASYAIVGKQIRKARAV